ncbi:TonB-dependent receptor [Belliella sp. DSM 107340]|uniref:TonB-dependent receptor n=1 Tax=Belliella calami TaxID=2923436 RepID=A0ABS9UTF4_9BACT|nr:TonB-dependent receptor [Belliella calami]MCH7399912.1 TonB-dependent receptor [Belliella calami]
MKKNLSSIMLLLLFLFNWGAKAQSVQVTGQVLDAQSSESLPGVNVLVKGSSIGTVTDIDGKFNIEAASGSTLVFSFIGYSTQEVRYTGQSSLTISLSSDTKDLQEVIVTGYGTQKRENLTGSIATVSGEKLTDITSPNIGNMLQGKVAGVDVVANSGAPGATPTIRIRGRSSIRSSATPIWVVDGVIWHDTPILNPNDVESISVLKDAAAAALYGSRGANGVIVVTTKGAKAGTSSISLNVKTGVSIFNRNDFQVMNSNQLADLWDQFPNTNAIPGWYDESLRERNTDWLDIGTQTGQVRDYNLSYSGTTERARLFTAFNYFNETGTVKGDTYERLSARINYDYDVNEKLTFKPKLAATYTTNDNARHSIYDMYRNLPWDQPFNEVGAPINTLAPGANWRGRDNRNYLYDLQWNYGNSATFNILSNLDFQYDINEYLSFISTNNLTYFNSESFGYTDPRSNSGLADNGRMSVGMNKRITRFTNQMLSYTRTFDKHFVNVLAGYEFNDYIFNNVSATGRGIAAGAQVISNASEPQAIGGTKNDYAFQSYLLNANYSYENRYSAQASFRRDGASRFGSNNKYGNFFSLSGAWNIHNEAFFNVSSINYLRAKVAYGQVGNTPDSLYPQFELFSLNAQYNGMPAAVASALGNPNLTWEKTAASNFGIELGLFNRIDFAAEYYIKNTTDLLHFVPLPNISGFDGYFDNIGSVINRGLELTLGADIIKSNGANWRLDFNIGMNRNEITELFENRRQISGNRIIEVGEDIDTWFMRKWVGVNPEDGTPLWERVDPTTGEVTQVGNYNNATLQKVGTSTPNFFGGLTSSFDYRGFYLNANMAFTQGAMVYHSARETFDSDGAYPTYNYMQLQPGWSRWSPENPNATHPQPIFGGNNEAHRPSSRFIEDVSFLRIRNITAGYRLPVSVVEKLKLTGLEVFVSGDNLFTFTNFSGLDPEAAIYGDTGSQYPLPRRVSVGLNLNF